MTVEESLYALGFYLYEKPEILAGIAAGIGLYFTAKTFRHQQKSDQLKLAESVFKDLRTLEKEQSEMNTKIIEMAHTDAYGFEAERLRADWRSRFFNTLEWLAFLVNERELSNKKIINYYSDAITRWYNEIFLQQASDAEKNDAKQYPELKKLYLLLKSGKQSSWHVLDKTFYKKLNENNSLYRKKFWLRMSSSIGGAAIMSIANYLLAAGGIIAPYSIEAFAVMFASGSSFLILVYILSERALIRLEERVDALEKK